MAARRAANVYLGYTLPGDTNYEPPRLIRVQCLGFYDDRSAVNCSGLVAEDSSYVGQEC